jgi:hypothetical protein
MARLYSTSLKVRVMRNRAASRKQNAPAEGSRWTLGQGIIQYLGQWIGSGLDATRPVQASCTGRGKNSVDACAQFHNRAYRNYAAFFMRVQALMASCSLIRGI